MLMGPHFDHELARSIACASSCHGAGDGHSKPLGGNETAISDACKVWDFQDLDRRMPVAAAGVG